MILEQHRYWQSQGWTPLRVIRLVNREQRRHGVDEKEYDDTGNGAFQAIHDLLDLIEVNEERKRAEQMGLTPRLRELLDYITQYIENRGFSPSYDEMCDRMGLATRSGITRMLKELRQRGYVNWIPGTARTITVLNHD